MESIKRIALVTGGMGGLGEAICFKLAALGYTVVTTCSPGNTRTQAWLQAMKLKGFDFHAYAATSPTGNPVRPASARLQARSGRWTCW